MKTILSEIFLLQTDVVGTCLSEYKVTDKDPKTKFVEKTKNLLGCSDREGYRMAIQSIGYNVPSVSILIHSPSLIVFFQFIANRFDQLSKQ